MRGSFREKLRRVCFLLTAMLLAYLFNNFMPGRPCANADVLVTTGSTMPAPLYMLWGDEYHKLHPETQLRYLAVGTSEVPTVFFQEPEEILAAVMRRFPKSS